MPSWKKILQSGTAVHVLNITASSLPNSTQPNIIGYDTASGRFTFFSTSSLVSGGSLIGGSGLTNYIPKWSNSTTLTSSIIFDNGTNVGIGTTTPSASLHIQGNLQISTGSLYTYGQNTDIDSGSIRTVMSVATGSYRAAFFDYVLNKSTNARAGTVFSVWNGASVEWNDVSTNDIGNTAEVNLSVGLSGANVLLYASSSTNDWSVKALSRML